MLHSSQVVRDTYTNILIHSDVFVAVVESAVVVVVVVATMLIQCLFVAIYCRRCCCDAVDVLLPQQQQQQLQFCIVFDLWATEAQNNYEAMH